ncbi:MAG: UvrD-helicase domain-containing protein, partial [Spirochaetales bacterium]
MSMDAILSQLNEQQRRAVLINEGSLLVFAGAGSGKTRVITTKIAYAVEKLGINPYRILAVTFTNKACREMQERVVSMIGDEGSSVMIRTFHSFGVWLLRKYGRRVGLDANFKIYDDDDSVQLLCQACPDDNKKEIAEYYKKISLLKDRMEKPN